MRIEHLQKLNIRGDHRDQIAAVSPFQLCRAEPSQRLKHLVANQSQQLKRDIVIARLLRVAQNCAQQRKNKQAGENHPKRMSRIKPQDIQHCITAKDRDKGGAKMPDQSHGYRQYHIACQWLYKTDQPCHHRKSASSFHAPAVSFPAFFFEAFFAAAPLCARASA